MGSKSSKASPDVAGSSKDSRDKAATSKASRDEEATRKPSRDEAAASTGLQIGGYLLDTKESKVLGRGNYRVIVYPGIHISSKQEVAAKRYEVFKDFPEYMLREVEAEANIMKNIPNHVNTIKIHDTIKTDGISSDGVEVIHFWLVIEYCSLGDLRKFARSTALSFPQKVDLMLQSALGLQHLHRHKVVHRDIKPANFLVAGTQDKPVIKIADFGESKIMTSTLRTSKGTPPFKAPELLKDSGLKYDETVDTFALGCSFLALLDYKKGGSMIPLVADQFIGNYVRDHPSADLSALIIKEEDGKEEADLKRLLAAMMGFDPSTRPSMQEVIDTLTDLLQATRPRDETNARQKESAHQDAQDINWGKVRITSAGSTKMPEETSSEVSFGRGGEILVADKSHLLLYRQSASLKSSSASSSPSTSHDLAKKTPLPRGLRRHSNKAVTDDALHVQKWSGDAPTLQLCIQRPHQHNTLNHPGKLLGALGEGLVYCVKRSYEDYIIHVHHPEKELILTPPAGHKWNHCLSVCSTTSFIVVVECYTRCLDVFSLNGEHITHMDLPYIPYVYSISKCGNSHVIVADCYSPPSLHIHHLPGGEEVRTISHEELGLQWNDCVEAVNYSDNGFITVAVQDRRDFYSMHSLRTYKVSSE